MQIMVIMNPRALDIPLMCDFPKEMTTTINGDGIENKWAVFITAGGGPSYEHHEKRDRNDVKELTRIFLEQGWKQDHILTNLK